MLAVRQAGLYWISEASGSISESMSNLQAADRIMDLWGCRISDDSALDLAKGRAVRPFLEAADPWLTEARVVAAHGALHNAQVDPCPLPSYTPCQQSAWLKHSAKHLHENAQRHA